MTIPQTVQQFLQVQKNQLIDLQELFEKYCNALPVFRFNSARYVINLIKSYLLPVLVNERDIEPTVGGGSTNLDSFLKAYTTSETKIFFPCE